MGLMCLFERSIILWNLINTLYDFGNLSAMGPKQWVPLSLMQILPMSTLAPRFVLNIREMCGRSTVYVGLGSGHGIDTGFGLTVLSNDGLGRSVIIFADSGGLGRDGEDIWMDRRTT